METTRLLAFLLCLAAGAAGASEEKQIWACRTASPDARPILHLVEWGARSYVKFAHVRFSAQHQSEGGREGWYWNNEGNGYYRYGMVLESDGKAWLHDFSETDTDGFSVPLDRFSCRRIS